MALSKNSGDPSSGRLAERRAVHEHLGGLLSAMPDHDLLALVGSVEGGSGWGLHRHVRLDGEPVFVKTIPMTELELANPGSTRNIFELPAHYQYGVGSAGFGAQRELAAHRSTTQWVLASEIEHFPLLFHHRVVPIAGQTREIGDELHQHLNACWGDDAAIARFLSARSAATHAIALFVEHIPFVIRDWIGEHPEFTDVAIDQAKVTTDFLRSKGVAHFDAHLDNVLTDGERLFFSDFGLFLDSAFELDAAELAFLDAHRFFDIAEFISSLSWPDRRGVSDHGPLHAGSLAPFRSVIEEFSAAFFDLAAGGVARSTYDDNRMRSLLDRAFAERYEKDLEI